MFVLTQSPSVADRFLAELRSVEIQKDSMRFRRNMERLGALIAYEISKELDYKKEEVQSPLEKASTYVLERKIVIGAILRAGIPFFQGFLNIFDQSESAFIAAYRSNKSEETGNVEINMDYVASPDLTGKVLILTDPMLATGKSLVVAYRTLLKYGKPSEVHLAAVLSSREGIEYVKNEIPEAKLWTVAIDEKMNEKFFIVPGLGDAGDLAFGPKK
ncbi:uracil phosphoribosyltransferase [Sporocytophaga myxococcoides]|uniref:Uracil phosphoribosyltransferase n=1 Tax=Sporocytophaga myxococcoides TaxID=153721 RepID=A0A098LAC3_9BACT|nr:uracil phosphoribosyltransferase [Sporocytophaga myxococcoides]GAL83845.1 uracil phosphoribosyltransferase [Sporocytophaga myxococcoides]